MTLGDDDSSADVSVGIVTCWKIGTHKTEAAPGCLADCCTHGIVLSNIISQEILKVIKH